MKSNVDQTPAETPENVPARPRVRVG